MGVRFVHAADFHLGSPLKTAGTADRQLSESLRDAGYTAVERIFDIAIEEGVDFLVVAGDVYDEDSRSVRANEFVAEQFERLAAADIRAYVAYGNHDPVGSAPTYVDLPETVHEFGHGGAEEAMYPDADAPEARIWGQSYRNRRESRKMYDRFAPADSRIPNVGVLHSGLNPQSNQYVPCSKADLESKDEIHYWALGHVHSCRVHTDAQPIVYPGIPQGRQITEPGFGGCFLVELEPGACRSLEFVPTCAIVWKEVPVSMESDGAESIQTIPEIQSRIEETASEVAPAPETQFSNTEVSVRDVPWEVAGYIVRWRLEGHCEAHETLTADRETLDVLASGLRDVFDARTPFVWTETVRDHTGPPMPGIDELRDEDRVVDDFLALADAIADDPEAREQFRDVAGTVWTDVDDHEDVEPDELPLTDETLDHLVDRARQVVVEELARRRA